MYKRQENARPNCTVLGEEGRGGLHTGVEGCWMGESFYSLKAQQCVRKQKQTPQTAHPSLSRGLQVKGSCSGACPHHQRADMKT